MGLGNRESRRHETAKTAGVRPEDYWDFKPGQKVMTVDGFLGKVEAVNDGPWAGSEEYQVTLDNGLGGGIYTSGQLRPATSATASHENTAAKDYPELAEILQERLDPGRYPDATLGLTASLRQTEALHQTHTSPVNGGQDGWRSECDNCGTVLKLHDTEDEAEDHANKHAKGVCVCSHCRMARGASLHQASLADEARFGPARPGVAGLGPAWQGMAGVEAAHHLGEVGGKPSMCPNGHLQWGNDCPACRNTDPSQNAMVVNENDHRPQNVGKTSGWTEDPNDDSPYNNLNYPEGDEDEDLEKSGAATKWNPHDLQGCGECGSLMHTSDEHDLFQQHGQGGNLDSDNDEPDYEHIPQIEAPEGDGFLVSRCPDHGTKSTRDLRSQHYYLDFSHNCHDQAWDEHGRSVQDHDREHDLDESECWSCCPNMEIAHPGQLESGQNYTASKTAGMHGMPLHEVGDKVINFRGESGTVTYVQDSGHPGKSNKVGVAIDGTENPPAGHPDHVYWDEVGEKHVAHNYESVWEPHPEAPQEQKDRYRQRKADNKAATDLLSSIEREHLGTRKTASFTDLCETDEDGYCHYHGQDQDECRRDAGDDRCGQCGSFWHDTDEHTDDNSDEGLIEPWADDHFEGDTREKTCPNCGNLYRHETGEHPYNGEGADMVCPNSREGRSIATERAKATLTPEHFCSEHCQDAYAYDKATGFSDREQARKNQDHGSCRHCGTPLMGSPGDQISQMGDPQALHFLKTNPTGPTKYSTLERGYELIRLAAADPSFGFHFTAAWKDVRNKARRIRSEGGVHMTAAQNGYYIAQVKGDHGTYEAVLLRAPGSQKVAQWDCGCTWAKYHWGAPDDYSRFAGRMCSHALALQFEAQSRGMFGREVRADDGAPAWLTKRDLGRTSAVEPWDDVEDVVQAEESHTGDRLPHTSSIPDYAPLALFLAAAVDADEDPLEVTALLTTLGAVNSPFGEPGPSQVPGISPKGPTEPRHQENPGSAGFLTAADPDGWSSQNPLDLSSRVASLDDDAVFEPEITKKANPALLIAPVVRALAPKIVEKVAPAMVPKLLGKDDPREEDDEGNKKPSGVEDFANKLKAWTDQSKAEGDMVRSDQARREGMLQAILEDEPEAALPETYGADEDEEQTYSGYAGDPEPDPRHAAINTGVEYAVPGDPGQSGGNMAPNSNFETDPTSLEPENPSFVSTGSTADIVAEFQRSAAAQTLNAGSAGAAKDNSDIAQAAAAFLKKEGMAVFTPAQQQELINEGEGVRASNLDRLEITGTHYEALDALSDDDDDDQSWMA